MAKKRFVRVGTSNPEEYEKITIERVTCDYYLKVFGELRRLDNKLEEGLILHLLRTKSPLLVRMNIRIETVTIYQPKRK
jgi:hypothetical protein